MFRKNKAYRILNSKFPLLKLGENIIFRGDIENLSCHGKVEIQDMCFIHLGGFPWCENKGRLIIGNGSCIGNNVTIYATGPHGVEIGENFDCAPGVKIFASRSDYINRGNHIFGKVVIEENVILFANVVISPGVKIGKNSVVAAGSVVTENIPPDTLAGGSPAKIIKSI